MDDLSKSATFANLKSAKNWSKLASLAFCQIFLLDDLQAAVPSVMLVILTPPSLRLGMGLSMRMPSGSPSFFSGVIAQRDRSTAGAT